jgi:hypothetical protein
MENEKQKLSALHFLLPQSRSFLPIFYLQVKLLRYFYSHTLDPLTKSIFHVCFHFLHNEKKKTFKFTFSAFYDLLDRLRHLTREIYDEEFFEASTSGSRRKFEEIVTGPRLFESILLSLQSLIITCSFSIHLPRRKFMYIFMQSAT